LKQLILNMAYFILRTARENPVIGSRLSVIGSKFAGFRFAGFETDRLKTD